MTNDITELAQRLNICAKEGAYPVLSPADCGALVEALEKSEKTSEARREAIDITHKRAARERDRANAAEEALEKAQQYAKERDAENQDLMLTVGRLRVEREELESRTVKLPNSNDERFWGYGSEFEVKLYDSCVFYALTAAGIKWEAE